jgi:hypothetical protein
MCRASKEAVLDHRHKCALTQLVKVTAKVTIFRVDSYLGRSACSRWLARRSLLQVRATKSVQGVLEMMAKQTRMI